MNIALRIAASTPLEYLAQIDRRNSPRQMTFFALHRRSPSKFLIPPIQPHCDLGFPARILHVMVIHQAMSRKEGILLQSVSRLEEVLTRLCHGRPTASATAQAINQRNPWERIAMKAIDSGHFRNADEFVQFVDACLRHLSFEQATHGRTYAIGIRSLADAIAHRWACAGSAKDAPTTDEIAGLLRSEWVLSGQFRSLRSAIRSSITEKKWP